MVNLRVERTLSMICVSQKKIPPVGEILLRCCWNSALKLTTFQSLRLICLKRVTRQCESLVWWKAFLKSFFQITKRVKTSSSLLGKLNKLLLLLLFSFVCLFLQILTNAPPLVYRWRTSTWQTFVIRTRTAPTPKDLTTAAVRRGMREMETIVKVGYNFIYFFLFYFFGGGRGVFIMHDPKIYKDSNMTSTASFYFKYWLHWPNFLPCVLRRCRWVLFRNTQLSCRRQLHQHQGIVLLHVSYGILRKWNNVCW